VTGIVEAASPRTLQSSVVPGRIARAVEFEAKEETLAECEMDGDVDREAIYATSEIIDNPSSSEMNLI